MAEYFAVILLAVILGGVIVPLILNWLMSREEGWKEKTLILICVILSCILTECTFKLYGI